MRDILISFYTRKKCSARRSRKRVYTDYLPQERKDIRKRKTFHATTFLFVIQGEFVTLHALIPFT